MMCRPSDRRPGFTLLEMVIAATLLGLVFAAVAQFLSRWDAARRSVEERLTALRLVENALEHVAARPLGEEAPAVELPAAGDRLRDAELRWTRGEPDDLGLVPVTASLSWTNAEGDRVSPVVLTAWMRSANETPGPSAEASP